MADGGYRDLTVVTPDKSKSALHKEQMALARARHETVNRCLKHNTALSSCWHHSPHSKHHLCFRACLVMTQLMFENGRPPFRVEYTENPAWMGDTMMRI